MELLISTFFIIHSSQGLLTTLDLVVYVRIERLLLIRLFKFEDMNEKELLLRED